MNKTQTRVDEIIAEIKLSQARPGWKPLTASQMRTREQVRRQAANTLALQRGWSAVRPEYHPVDAVEED